MWASGKYSRAICMRCGFEFSYKELVTEPGTKLRVCHECNDKQFNRVTAPLNRAPVKTADYIGLRNPRPDETEDGIGWLLTDDGSGYILQETSSKVLTEGTQ